MSHINTEVVRALMELRGIDAPTLCKFAHVTHANMNAWLYGDVEGDAKADEAIEYDTQLEILKFLGIVGEAPRGDVIHYWRLHESFFSRAHRTYWALDVVLKAFGQAKAAFLTRAADPFISFRGKSCFALRFGSFNAILEVTTHPLRSVSFAPGEMDSVDWLPDTFAVALTDEQYLALEPGSMKVKALTKSLSYTAEAAQWERLRNLANREGVSVEHVATLLKQAHPALPLDGVVGKSSPQLAAPAAAAAPTVAPVVDLPAASVDEPLADADVPPAIAPSVAPPVASVPVQAPVSTVIADPARKNRLILRPA